MENVRPRLRPRFANLTVGMPFGLGKVVVLYKTAALIKCQCGGIFRVSNKMVDSAQGGKKHLYCCGSKLCVAICWKFKRLRLNMLTRCNYVNSNCYDHYGERGISCCLRYKYNISALIADAFKLGWKPDLEIDRINTNLGYSPTNIRFVTHRENVNNRGITYYLEWEGERLPHTVLAERLNIPSEALRYRLRRGWSLEEALKSPYQYTTSSVRLSKITY